MTDPQPNPDTPDPHVISALRENRARIDGEIKTRRYQIMRLEAELAHIDAVIRMFRPSYDIDAILPKRSFGKNPAGVPRGAGGRYALSILREAAEPLTSQEIARRVLAKLGKPATDDGVGMMAKTVHSTLSRRKDSAVRFDASTHPGRWSLV